VRGSGLIPLKIDRPHVIGPLGPDGMSTTVDLQAITYTAATQSTV
jgi:hypothetical protein